MNGEGLSLLPALDRGDVASEIGGDLLPGVQTVSSIGAGAAVDA
jgi:hypothetical protein